MISKSATSADHRWTSNHFNHCSPQICLNLILARYSIS